MLRRAVLLCVFAVFLIAPLRPSMAAEGREVTSDLPSILQRLVPPALGKQEGLPEILQGVRPNGEAGDRGPANSGGSLVDSLRNLQRLLERHDVVNKLLPKGPAPPAAPSSPPQDLVDSLRSLDRQLKRHRVVEQFVPEQPGRPNDLIGALRALQRDVNQHVLPALREIDRAMSPPRR